MGVFRTFTEESVHVAIAAELNHRGLYAWSARDAGKMNQVHEELYIRTTDLELADGENSQGNGQRLNNPKKHWLSSSLATSRLSEEIKLKN